jgi:cyclophilin family peptidyl-prolyl cis-trans isomerase
LVLIGLTLAGTTTFAPLACENFMKLCVGAGISSSGAQLCYASCPIHRIVPGGWLQCGDIVDGSGANSISASGDSQPVGDESFAVDFGNVDGGVVGYSSSAPHENGSQFFVTFAACEWMQNSFVGFGRIVVGNSILRRLENEKTRNQKPERTIIISECGIEYKP